MATFTGTSGNDTITPVLISVGVVTSPVGSFPTAAADTIDGGSGDDVIDGGGGADLITGGVGFDTLSGGAGNDTLDVTTGDSVTGGADNDLFLVFSAGSGTTIAGGTGIDTLEAQGTVNLSQSSMTGMDVLALDGATLTMTSAQLVQFLTIKADAGAPVGNLTLSAGGASALTDVTELTTLNVTGAAGVDLLTFTTSGRIVTDISVNSGNGNDSITTGSGNDTITLGIGNDTASGNAGNDSILGGTGADNLSGGAGNDSLFGDDALADTLSGGADADLLDGGGGIDLVNGGTGNDTIHVRAGGIFDGDEDDDLFRIFSVGAGTVITGDLGTDTMEAQGALNISLAAISGFERLALDAFTLTLTNAQLIDFDVIEADGAATEGVLVLTGGAAASVTTVTELATLTVTGSSSNDGLTLSSVSTEIVVDGGDGDDTITSGSLDDTLTGGIGLDSLSGGSGNDSLIGGDGSDTLNGGADNDTLVGGGAIDFLNGGTGNDSIIGAAGDVVSGGTGNDTINIDGTGTYDGDEDDDTFQILGAGLGTVIAGGLGIDKLDAQGAQDITGASLSGIELLALDTSTLTLSASQLAVFDEIIADGAALDGVITLSGGSNLASTTVSQLRTLTVNGSASNEFLRFFTAVGVPTNIVFDGNLGDDIIDTAAGNDTLRGDAGDDSLDGGFGDDVLDGGNNNDSLVGGAGNDLLVGSDAGIDTMSGGSGNDTIRMGEDDVVDGDDNDDVIEVLGNLNGPMTVAGGLGTDRLDAQGSVSFGSAVVFQGIEELALDANVLTMTAAQLDSFERIVADGAAVAGEVVLSVAGSAFVGVTGLQTLTVTGTGGGDTLSFTSNGPGATDIAIDAGNGDDSIYTGAGDDTVEGGAGNDFLSGRGGYDSITGGIGDDTIMLADGGTARGGNDNDTLRFDAGTTILTTVFDGGLGIDRFDPQGAVILTGLASFVSVEHLALDSSVLTLLTAQLEGFQTIVADAGAPIGNIVLSDSGTAIVNVEELGFLNVTGSGGNNTLAFSTTGAVLTDISVIAGDGDDVITTDDGDDTIDGGTGNDFLRSGSGLDSVVGGIGNDTIEITDGGRAYGGEDNDVLRLGGTNTVLATVFDGGAGTDTFDAQGAQVIGALTTFTDVEQLALDASVLTLRAAQLESFTTIVSDSGILTGALALSAGGAATTALTGLTTLTLTGSGQADLLTFTTSGAPTAISASLSGGADVLTAGEGADTILGESGNDTIFGNGGLDSLDGGLNNDSLDGGLAADTLNGGNGNDTLRGGTGSGNDRLNGGLGEDLMIGGNGNDTYFVDNVLDVVDETGTTGIDLVSSTLSFTLGTNLENLTLTGAGDTSGTGNAAGNTIRGNAGANTLTGLEGNDSLAGFGGADTLVGGIGNDTLTGGGGADQFLFFTPAEGVDIIRDFVSGTDRILIDDAGFGSLALGLMNAGNFIAKAGPEATNPAGIAQVIYDSNTGNLWFDADGTGAGIGVQFATLNGAPAILASDIEVI